MNRVERPKASLLSRAIGYVSDAWLMAKDPKQAHERRFWRDQGHRFASMTAGAMDKAMAEWNPPDGDANAVTLEDLPVVRARARDSALNDPIAQAVRRTMADHVIGNGMTPECLVDYERLGITEEQAKEWQGQCKDHFTKMSAQADVTGRLTFQQLQRLIFLSVWDGGDVFPSFPMTPGDDGVRRTRINLIEAERVDTPPGQVANPNILGGVQVDSWSRIEGFWVYRGHPGDARPQRDRMKFEFWPVVKGGRRNVLQLYQQERIGQARGVPGFAQALALTDHTSNYFDEILLACRIQNAMSIWIESAGDPAKVAEGIAATLGGRSSDPYREIKERGIVPGSVNTLRKGDKAGFLGPSTPGQYTDPFLVRLLRAIAACIGAPYEIVFGDVGAANYSSIRAAFQTFRKTIGNWQGIVRPALDAYWIHTIREAWLDGKLGKFGLSVPFNDSPEDWARVTWTPPKAGYIDPTKEMAAYKIGVDNGFMSRSQVIAEGGGNASDVFQQLANEQEELDELGVTLGAFLPQQGSPAPAPQDQEDSPSSSGDSANSKSQKNDQPAEEASQK